MPKTVKIHMTFDDHKRIFPFQKGGEVHALRYRFLQEFSDVLYDKAAPADFKFQRYDPSFDKYHDVKDEEKLESDTIMRATRTNSSGGLIVPHPVNPQTNYRLWNLVSNGLLQRDPSDNSVNGNGSFGGSNTVITTSAISSDVMKLLFMDGTNNAYAVTVRVTNGVVDITAELSPPPGRAEFVAEYFFGYTLFKTKLDSTKYLGCDSAGKATLVDISSLQYPNPQSLFVLSND